MIRSNPNEYCPWTNLAGQKIKRKKYSHQSRMAWNPSPPPSAERITKIELVLMLFAYPMTVVSRLIKVKSVSDFELILV